MLNKPIVSIILTVFNGEKFLFQAISSVINQSYENFELIIVNDASIDNSDHIIKAFWDQRIVYLRNKNNRNIVESRNIGIKKACGEYICFLDQDDVLLRDKLQRQVDFLIANKDYWLVGCNILNISEENKIISHVMLPETDTDIRKRLLRSSQFACGAVLMRKQSMDLVGLLNSDFIRTDDYDLWLRLGRIAKMHNMQEYLFQYRLHEQNTSNRNYRDMILKSIKLCFKYRSDYPNFYISIIAWFWYMILPRKISHSILSFVKWSSIKFPSV